MGRNSEAVVAQRTEDIYGLVVDGQPLGQIRQFVDERLPWGKSVSDRTLRRYMKRATDLIRDRAEETCKHAHGVAVTRLERLYAKAVRREDLKTALDIQKEISRLHGLNAPTKTELTGANGTPLIATTEQMAARFDELVNAQAARLKKAPKR